MSQSKKTVIEAEKRAPRNRTVRLTTDEHKSCAQRILRLREPASVAEVLDRTICQDALEAVQLLPSQFVDLLVLDPPYNLSKSFNGTEFKKRSTADYAAWLDERIAAFRRVLKLTASIYICSEWNSSAAVFSVAEKYFAVRNRITWEREKGRGSASNWKNCSEDIWFCTASDSYTFNVDAVKLKRRVLAPYTDGQGIPKDWDASVDGRFRFTHPSNLWTDITVPFWSMRENTDHPTQKPEKLIAKLVLASSNPGDVVLDPFLGSGTTSVVAKKLARRYVGIELEDDYCCLAEKRLDIAGQDGAIQGYCDGVFWERNSHADQRESLVNGNRRSAAANPPSLFTE